MERDIKELQQQDYDWIAQRVSEGLKICEHYGVSSGRVSPANLDAVFHSWWKDKGNDRVSHENMVNCLGCLFGETLQKQFNLKWKIVTDQFGTDLILQTDITGKSWEVAPLSFVAKRVESSEDESGFFVGLESLLTREIGKGG